MARTVFIPRLLLLASLAASAAGCVVTSEVRFAVPTEVFGTAVCSCALCWDRPFCHRGDTDFAEPVDGACPDGFRLAEVASRVTGFRSARETFFCAGVDGTTLDHTTLMVPPSDGSPPGSWCPTPGTRDRARLHAFNPCQDVVTECRDPLDPEFASCAVLPPDTSGCRVGYQRGVEVSACSNDPGLEHVTDKLMEACTHGLGALGVPNGSRPERYCFTACLDPMAFEYDGPSATCAESLFDPPEVTAGAYAWVLSGTSSTATITVGDETASFGIEGRVAFHSPRCLAGDACPAELSFVRAEVPGSFTLGGRTFEDVVFQNPVPIRGGRVVPETSVRSRVEFPAGAQLFATADVSGFAERSGALVTSSVPVRGLIRWDARTIVIEATFADAATSTTVALHIEGAIPNRAPIANAGSDREVECTGSDGAEVALSGAGSFDPDEPQGAGRGLFYNWTNAPVNDLPAMALPGREVAVRQPIGEADYELTVLDAGGSSTTDSVHVSVLDSTAPAFDTSALPLCIPDDGRMRLFRPVDYASAFADVCDQALRFGVLDIASSQVDRGPRSPDARRAIGGSFCVRGERELLSTGARTYTITIEAMDDAGNRRVSAFPVMVPNGACPADAWSVPAVADAVAECGGDLPDAGAPDAGRPEPPSHACSCRAVGSVGSAFGASIVPIAFAVFVVARWRHRRACSLR